MGVPLQPGITYMASTKLKAPVPVLYDNVLDAAISTGRAKMMKWSLPMEYGNSGTATKVNLLLTGGNELQPGEFHAGVAIKWHEELGANQ